MILRKKILHTGLLVSVIIGTILSLSFAPITVDAAVTSTGRQCPVGTSVHPTNSEKCARRATTCESGWRYMTGICVNTTTGERKPPALVEVEPLAGTEGLPACTTGYRTEVPVGLSNNEFKYFNTDGSRCNPAPGQRAPGDALAPTGCSARLDSGWFSPSCWWYWGLSVFGATLVWFGAKMLVIAGNIFEVSLSYTVVEFGKHLAALKPGIDAGWSALRDIANIVIIGLFAFIAVNIILGVKEFGDKKRVAHVLIVAVLINFSLLFTKIIIDASNFTAYQFYNNMIGGTFKESTTVIPGLASAESIIAPRFMQHLGVTGFSDSLDKLYEGTDKGKFYHAIVYGILSFMLLMGAAFVFFYGAFLLISRGVLLVFLMLTAPIAFASWLIPQHYIEKGFSKWWESLLKAAFFAPILVALLWATMTVATQISVSIKAKGGGGSLGDLAAHASSEANGFAVLGYFLVLGLLYGSFAAASAFSKTIGGFAAASKLWTAPTSTGFSAASRLGGMFGRTFAGGGANWAFRKMQGAGFAETALGRTAMRPFNWAASKSFDAMRVGAVRKAVEGLGGITGDKDIGKGGFRALKEHQAEQLHKLSKALAPGKGDRERMAGEAGHEAGTKARGREEEQINKERMALAKQKDAADAAHVAAEAALEKKKKEIHEEHGKNTGVIEAKAQKESAETAHKAAREQRDEIVKAIAQQAEGPDKEKMVTERKRLDANIEAQEVRIRQASAVIGPAEAKLAADLKAAEEDARPIREAAEKATGNLEKLNAEAPARLQKAYAGAHKEAKDKRDTELQAKTIARAMVRNKTLVGRDEILRQLPEQLEKDALKKAAVAFGEAKAAEHKAEAPAPKPAPASPPPAADHH
jgi:hypothetical protein